MRLLLLSLLLLGAGCSSSSIEPPPPPQDAGSNVPLACTPPGSVQAALCPPGTDLSKSFFCPRDPSVDAAGGGWPWPSYTAVDASYSCVSHLETSTGGLVICCPSSSDAGTE